MLKVERLVFEEQIFPGEEPEKDHVMVDWSVVLVIDYDDDPYDLTAEKIGLCASEFSENEGNRVNVFLLTDENGYRIKNLEPYSSVADDFWNKFHSMIPKQAPCHSEQRSLILQ